jgi:hypothetical protein
VAVDVHRPLTARIPAPLLLPAAVPPVARFFYCRGRSRYTRRRCEFRWWRWRRRSRSGQSAINRKPRHAGNPAADVERLGTAQPPPNARARPRPTCGERDFGDRRSGDGARSCNERGRGSETTDLRERVSGRASSAPCSREIGAIVNPDDHACRACTQRSSSEVKRYRGEAWGFQRNGRVREAPAGLLNSFSAAGPAVLPAAVLRRTAGERVGGADRMRAICWYRQIWRLLVTLDAADADRREARRDRPGLATCSPGDLVLRGFVLDLRRIW